MQLGLENKKKATWAAVLGAVALLVFVYEFLPMFTGSSSEPSSSAQAAAPVSGPRNPSPRSGVKGRKVRAENLDPTLRLDLLASSEQTVYEGSGRNIFVSQSDPVIQKPQGNGTTDHAEAEKPWTPPVQQPAPPIPLKFFGFASKPGEPKKIFLQQGEDIFVAGEGEIVNRRYKVIRIMPTAVEMQDVVNSGPPQNIPLTLGQG